MRSWLRLALLCLAGTFGTVHRIAAQVEPTSSFSAGSESSSPSGVGGALEREAKIYLDDGRALFMAPFSWTTEDQKKAVVIVGLIGGLMVFDRRLAYESQERRSSFTDSVARATNGFGSEYAWAISGGLLASGIAFHNPHFTAIGREAIEAGIFASLITTTLEHTFGRERPEKSNNEVLFKPFSSNTSFPSGHATMAFAVASVISARSSGWFWPTLAYTTASIVAFDRVNDHVHFPSDVLAGAVVGITVGRFIVHRHQKSEAENPKVSVSLVPIRDGLGVLARF